MLVHTLCIFLFYREQNEELKRQAELKRTCELLNQHKEQLTQITKDKQGHSDSETLNGASDEDSGLFDIDSLVKNTIPNSEISCDTELNDEVKILWQWHNWCSFVATNEISRENTKKKYQ